MPLDGEDLVIEPGFPKAAELMTITRKPATDKADPEDEGWELVNSWHSRRRRSDILIMRKGGKTSWGLRPAVHGISQALSTLGCSVAWGIEQEQKALQLLATMIRHHNFKQYLLTGMFLERSERSGVTYLFRRLRPTVALAANPGLPEPSYGMRILCSLCLHPIGYYAGTWAGAMCPTDDVIAHLAMMRADEHGFWKAANHHAPWHPAAGL